MDKRFQPVTSSFRDPDGFVFRDESNSIYRQLNISYTENYQLLINSGLYKKLTDSGKLISHEEKPEVICEKENHFKTILPEQIPFISYPYEWCFDQFKDAALLTLEVMKLSLEHGMSLKDATPFNVQFFNGRTVFIDTCSFEKYEEGKPWIAYKQFCETFFAPLLLMSYVHPEMNQLLLSHPEGIPLKMASNMLPLRSYFNVPVLLHLHFHAGFRNKKKGNNSLKMPKQRLLMLIDSLRSAVEKLKVRKMSSDWQDYYSETILSETYINEKKKVVNEILDTISVKTAIDIGCNDGMFSQMLYGKGIHTIAIDPDSNCINSFYELCKRKDLKNIYPLTVDILNPSPSIGWNNTERNSFFKRSKSELVLALAVVHHLAIGKNISFEMTAQLFSSIGNSLVIEFVPKSDEKMKQMLQNRKDIFTSYNEENFERVFGKYFQLVSKNKISKTGRIIYHFEKISS
ncbi:MAG: SAM-dependent methyltransferase [Bacteroidia bacterium]